MFLLTRPWVVVRIMRGIPGSGKSTWHRKHYPDAVVLSADAFFLKASGTYNFDKERLPEAHATCLVGFDTTLRVAVDNTPRLWTRTPRPIVVDNTNVRMHEIAPYYRLPEAMGADVEIVHIHCDPEVAAARCVHGVPAETVRDMAQSFEPLPPWWKVRHVFPEPATVPTVSPESDNDR